MNQKKVVILSDIHSGSEYAVKSPWATVREDDTHSQMNSQQEVLFDHWKDLSKKWRRPDVLIINGDLIEGLQPKSQLTHCWSSDLFDQADDCIRLVNMFGAKTIYVVRGTPYHTQTRGIDIEESIAKELGAVKERSRYSTEFKLLDISPNRFIGRIVHVTHHIAGSKWFMYRSTALARDMASMMLNESHFVERDIGQKIFGIIRAHNHYFWYSESATRIMIQGPCWQLMTPFAHKVAATSPGDIGAIMLTMFEDGSWNKEHSLLKSKGMLPVVHRK